MGRAFLSLLFSILFSSLSLFSLSLPLSLSCLVLPLSLSFSLFNVSVCPKYRIASLCFFLGPTKCPPHQMTPFFAPFLLSFFGLAISRPLFCLCHRHHTHTHTRPPLFPLPPPPPNLIDDNQHRSALLRRARATRLGSEIAVMRAETATLRSELVRWCDPAALPHAAAATPRPGPSPHRHCSSLTHR